MVTFLTHGDGVEGRRGWGELDAEHGVRGGGGGGRLVEQKMPRRREGPEVVFVFMSWLIETFDLIQNQIKPLPSA